ncbi:hypothetical protein P5V47_11145 [Mycobacteroides abscessus subsp. massiliense]|uniref:hypothetical protein n=1 Tax=Mycobacteroides abscessus TaxID=36809 RepID=UPI00266D10A7|nr:hypothetical protein [Mycobacteroides abscessus]MDO3299245.1 hypothetical protein [Mycobacteroides abscessus subsp. massiliense]
MSLPPRRRRRTVYGAGRIDQQQRQQLETPGDHTLLEIEKVHAIASDPAQYAIADRIPDREPGTPGRPPLYPNWVHVVHTSLHGAFGSANAASRIMNYPDYWAIICGHAADHGKTARSTPPKRHHHTYAQPKLDRHIEQLQDGLRQTGADLARRLGCLNPDKPVSRTNPARGQFVVGDGTVVPPPYRKKTVERLTAAGRCRIVAHNEVQNGDGAPEFRYGTKFATLSTRPDATRNLRVILGTEPVPHGKGYTGEAGIALKMLDRVIAHPDLRVDGICYDGAFRGTHIDHAMKQGLTVLAPTHAGTAKPTFFAQIKCRCRDTHDIWTVDGRLHERSIIDTGEMAYEPLPIHKIYARRNPGGTHRWYIDFATVCGTIQAHYRIDTTDKDHERGYNRAEHLRQFTKTDAGDGVYDRCYGWREDAESLNNTLDRTLYGGRMTAHSPTRQHAVMIGFALGRNAIAHYLHRCLQKTAAA